jgi:hypothetical protein
MEAGHHPNVLDGKRELSAEEHLTIILQRKLDGTPRESELLDPFAKRLRKDLDDVLAAQRAWSPSSGMRRPLDSYKCAELTSSFMQPKWEWEARLLRARREGRGDHGRALPGQVCEGRVPVRPDRAAPRRVLWGRGASARAPPGRPALSRRSYAESSSSASPLCALIPCTRAPAPPSGNPR